MKARVFPTAGLRRVVGVPGAVLLGLGSILGTGVFVSLGIAAGVAGANVIWAVLAGAVVATFNGLSSAQLASSHPVSGGTYEYGYRYLSPAIGFTAGWMFLCAKSASAATAALGFSGYVLAAFGGLPAGLGVDFGVVLALVAVAFLTAIVSGGMSRSNMANAVMVGLSLVALSAFVGFGLPSAIAGSQEHLRDLFHSGEGTGGVKGLLHATALMFVAYTGYGRIATLGEEVRSPRKSIPQAIVVTLVSTSGLYAIVALVAVGSVGAEVLAAAAERANAPLEVIAKGFGPPVLPWVVAVGAVTAMLGVLLNLLLGLSRVVLAMARRGDLPARFARIDERHGSPRRAVVLVGTLTAGLVATGSVKATWSFSAFTVLVYYALTNLAALRLPPEAQLYPRWISWMGLASCVGLAFWVEPMIWLTGLGLIGAGLLWHRASVSQRRAAP